MSSANTLVNCIGHLLFRNIREELETGGISDIATVKTRVEESIHEFDRTRALEEQSRTNDLIGDILLEIGTLQENMSQCESKLADFKRQAEILKGDAVPVASRTEDQLVVQQYANNEAHAARHKPSVEANVPVLCIAPAPSPLDSHLRPAPSQHAVVSFPGGERTITIHPPNSPNYQSIIRDEYGDIILDFRKRSEQIKRERAFLGPDCPPTDSSRLYGRGYDIPRDMITPPYRRCPDRSAPVSCPLPDRLPSNVTAQQRELASLLQTDVFGCVIPPDHLKNNERSPSLPSSLSSSKEPSHDSHSSSSKEAKPETTSSVSSSSPSPLVSKGKKRTREDEEENSEGTLVAAEKREEAPLVEVPKTPAPVHHVGTSAAGGPSKRKKMRSTEQEGLPKRSICRTETHFDVAHRA